MSMRDAVAFATLSTLPFLTACGGGEAPKPAPAPSAETKAAAAPAAPAAGGSALSGKISFEGTVPPAEKVKLSADPKCVAMHKEGLEKQAILVKDGGLANVLVYVKTGANGTYTPPTTPVELTQTGCNYDPHVVAVQAGQPIEIVNSDDTLHNIHPRPKTNSEFNFGQPKAGMKAQRTFDKPEIMIPVGCDVHPWMRSYIHVLANPYFTVTGADGSFTIKDLPAGEYEIEAVHEKLGTMAGKVTVKAGEPASLNLTFKG